MSTEQKGHACTLGICGNLRIMSIVRLWNCEASRPRTFRVGNGSFSAWGKGESSISSGVIGPEDDDDDDAGLMGCS
jgi:hypothetical protein